MMQQPPNVGTSHVVHYIQRGGLEMWEMYVLEHYELSFLERLSSFVLLV